MSVIKPPAVRPEAPAIEALFASEVADQGFVSTHTSVLSLNAEAYEAWEALSAAVHRSMGTRRYELVTLAAAGAIGSAHCRLAHGRKSLEVFGREQLLRIARDYHSAGLDESEVAMMEFAERVSTDASSMTDDDSAHLRRLGLSDAQIVDVALAAAARNFYSRAIQALAIERDPVDLDDELSEALLNGLPQRRLYRQPLEHAHRLALRWLDSVPTRRVELGSSGRAPARRASRSSPPCASPG
jgi:uncharacterized peroxidase-related enzyme